MGGRQSKPINLTYEEAIKRVNESALGRIKDAYKRTATLNGALSRQAFNKEVLGDGVSAHLAEHIFMACGGTTRGILFRDLMCSLVLLTEGSFDEKAKFIFGVYANESGSHVVKSEMLRQLQHSEDNFSMAKLQKLFSQGDKVTFEVFGEWLKSNRDATTITCWLLDHQSKISLIADSQTPTFYQTLAGVTHLEESQISELESRYWSLKGSSAKLDAETLIPLMSPPLPLVLAKGVFNAFDVNRDNHIDFKEMACGISAACRGPITERQRFCFKVFDRDGDGRLSKSELRFMAQALLSLRSSEALETDASKQPTCNSQSDVCFGVCEKEVDSVIDELLVNHDTSNSGFISQEEFLIWTLSNDLTAAFTDITYQICHIILGLKPITPQEEKKIVMGWLERAEKSQLTVGQYWYIVTMDWWNGWLAYVSPITSKYYSLKNSEDCVYPGVPSSNPSPSGSQNGTLKRKKFSESNLEDSIATDNSGVTIMSIANFDRNNSTCDSGRNYSSSSLVVTSLESRGSSPCPSPFGSRRSNSSQSSVGGRPPAIDNNNLLETSVCKATQLTNEGGRLKKNVVLGQGRDFVLVPESLWKILKHWYGGAPALPRKLIPGRSNGEVEFELYPYTLRILRHTSSQNKSFNVTNCSWSGLVGNYGATPFNASQYYISSLAMSSPKRALSHLAAFSRHSSIKEAYTLLSTKLRIPIEDIRLWHVKDEPPGMSLLDDEDTLESAALHDLAQILMEVRNKDSTWPEEMSQISRNSVPYPVKLKNGPEEKGVTGLNNLGNTCFLNAALQCCSNTVPLTAYFIHNMHLYELNPISQNGMGGHMARQYGALLHELWAGSAKSVAPLKLRWTIGQYNESFASFQQHDSQELLAFLLDGLHEDLNRVRKKPYIELEDSEGRPDELVAQEAWENHILRNNSIIVDLFHGQLKSKVKCSFCYNETVRFDPFSYLTVHLPMENYVYLEAVVIKLTGETPVKYGMRMNSDLKMVAAKTQIHALSGVEPERLLLVDLHLSQIRKIIHDDIRVNSYSSVLYAYELPSNDSMEKLATVQSSGSTKDKDRQLFKLIQRSTTSHSSLNLTVQTNCNANVANASQKIIPNGLSDTVGGCIQIPNNSIVTVANDNDKCKQPSNATPQSGRISCPIHYLSDLNNINKGFIVAFHRKMELQDVYFLSTQKARPSLFGLPLVIACDPSTRNQDLYQEVWVQVSRLVSPLPPSEIPASNHAQDCDDSLGYEFPFVLSQVDREGLHCAICPWYRFCRGCKIPFDDRPCSMEVAYLAVDWDPTALHLRYQFSLETKFIVDSSVPEMQQKHSEPISLSDCLEAFCSEETLDYSCEKCKSLQQAAKKLQIWRLPPILIVHLKRFQFVGNRWIKSQKNVDFPLRGFDPTDYLASVPQYAIRLHEAELEGIDPETCADNMRTKSNFLHVVPENLSTDEQLDSPKISKVPNGFSGSFLSSSPQSHPEGMEKRRRVRNGSVMYGDALQDFHQHKLKDGEDPLDLKYNLYAIACHTGILDGGHYVCYAKNPQGRWICFNDSSCKEVSESKIDLSSAYLLFYEREGLDSEAYLPNIKDKTPVSMPVETEEDKRQCSVM